MCILYDETKGIEPIMWEICLNYILIIEIQEDFCQNSDINMFTHMAHVLWKDNEMMMIMSLWQTCDMWDGISIACFDDHRYVEHVYLQMLLWIS